MRLCPIDLGRSRIRCQLPLLEFAPPSSYCRSHNLKQDDIEYAIENTQVILAPERQIATFGNTSFEFHLISELMDRVDQVRIDRKSTRLNSSHDQISYAVFCLKK